MTKIAEKATFDRLIRTPKKGAATLTLFIVSVALTGSALAAPEIASPVTQYDRQMAQSSDAGQKPGSQQGGRIEPWERLDMTQEVDAIQGLDAEIGSSGVSTQDAQADHLFNRMKDDPEWLTLKGQVDNYANREEDLEFRVDRLENLDYNWEPAGTLASGWNLLGATPTGSWSPAISNQKTNFTQTIDRVLSYNKKLEEQERNIVTGEIKTVKESYITKTENDTISRNINVALGGWTNTGSLHSCSGWSPATNTVDQGKSFTQTQTCKQNQQRNVSYTVASTGENPGGAWTDTKTINVNQTRSATGTKNECIYDPSDITKGSFSIGIGVNSETGRQMAMAVSTTWPPNPNSFYKNWTSLDQESSIINNGHYIVDGYKYYPGEFILIETVAAGYQYRRYELCRTKI